MQTFEKAIFIILIALIMLFLLILLVFLSNKFSWIKPDEVDKTKKLRKRSIYTLMKRIADILISSLVLLIMGPFLLLMTILIKIEDGGPVVFYRSCVGYKGKEFFYRTFRTLRMADDFDPGVSTLEDPRVTKVGSFLRKTELDYLPMFADVFLGRLSIVGLTRIRPHERMCFTKDYSVLFNYAKPGIVGMSMTNEEMFNFKDCELLDFAYVQSLGFLTDIKLLLYAIRNTLVGTTRTIEPQKKGKY